MKVRAAGLLDLARIEELHRSVDSFPNETSVPAARLWSLLSSTLSALLPLAQETLIYVAEDGGKVLGFIQASGKPLGLDLPRAKVLQVLNLQVADSAESEDIAAALIEHLANQALQRGVHRLFVRLPDRDALLPVFRLRGFRQYATEQILFAENPRSRRRPVDPARRRAAPVSAVPQSHARARLAARGSDLSRVARAARRVDGTSHRARVEHAGDCRRPDRAGRLGEGGAQHRRPAPHAQLSSAAGAAAAG
jgi:GNAT superfamily N-acetyltransferase